MPCQAEIELFSSCTFSNTLFETSFPCVCGVGQKYNGSISAEHGVGRTKKPYLEYSRSPEEIGYMKAVKAVFDPNNIMNPGKVIDA